MSRWRNGKTLLRQKLLLRNERKRIAVFNVTSNPDGAISVKYNR